MLKFNQICRWVFRVLSFLVLIFVVIEIINHNFFLFRWAGCDTITCSRWIYYFNIFSHYFARLWLFSFLVTLVFKKFSDRKRNIAIIVALILSWFVGPPVLGAIAFVVLTILSLVVALVSGGKQGGVFEQLGGGF